MTPCAFYLALRPVPELRQQDEFAHLRHFFGYGVATGCAIEEFEVDDIEQKNSGKSVSLASEMARSIVG